MVKIFRAALLVSILSLLAGCAGRDFVRPSSDAFKLGQTTYSQVVQQMGEPRRTGEALTNGQNVKSMVYSYATVGGEPLEEGVTAARAMAYYFHNDKSVGQEFISSFKSDNSNFDETKIAAIDKGKTTRAEVVQLMGPPSASLIPPMVKETSGEAIGYVYATTRGGAFSGFKIFRKVLKIAFDEGGRVSDIDYSSSGSK